MWLMSLSPFIPTGSVDLRYKLGLITHKYQLTHRNLADGYPHYINITRHNRTIKTQVYALTAATVLNSHLWFVVFYSVVYTFKLREVMHYVLKKHRLIGNTMCK